MELTDFLFIINLFCLTKYCILIFIKINHSKKEYHTIIMDNIL